MLLNSREGQNRVNLLMLNLEVASWVEYLFYPGVLHIFSAFDDREQILQYFLSLSHSFVPVDSFLIICPIYASLLALERSRFFHFSFKAVAQICGATTKICVNA